MSLDIKLRLFRLTPGLLESGPIFPADGRSLLPSKVRAYRRADCPWVRLEMGHHAFGIYRLSLPATGTASRSVFVLRNVSPGACVIAWG